MPGYSMHKVLCAVIDTAEKNLDGRLIIWEDKLRAALESVGVQLVSDADKRVLDAAALVPVTWLEMAVNASQIARGLAPLAAAELARRALLHSGEQSAPTTDNPAENKPVPR